MPPGANSRYRFCEGIQMDDGSIDLSPRVPYRYRALNDTREHIVTEGETLHLLADVYYGSVPRAADWWWVIADFQPKPILDPTIQLTAGMLLYIPSRRVVEDVILGEARCRVRW